MNTLEVRNLSKSFNQNRVYENLNFTITSGEFVSILGPSGSGKSTLFHLIGGLLKPDHGCILFGGKDITGKTGQMSYMPQEPTLFPWRTLQENVVLGQEIHEKRDVARAQRMLEIAGLTDYEQAYPHELSGGMKQRAAFVRALLSPQLLMGLDEPFSALDEFTRQEMQQWLLSLWERDRRTVLFVTHNIEEALFLSDRLLILSDRPAHLIADVHIPFPRPREASLFLSQEFFEWKRKVSKMMRSEGR